MSELTAKPRGRLEGLQVLRASAALLVLWCHLKFNLGISEASVSNIPLLATNFGAIGVDIFFVISGFVIAMTATKVDRDWKGFIAGRIARVVPLYFALSSYDLLEAYISSKFNHAPMRLSSRQIFNAYAFLPLFDGERFSGPIITSGWTLSFEMWFYLCFAGLIKWKDGRRAGTWLPALMGSGILLTTLFYRASGWFLPRFLFHPIILEFCAGCLLYQLRDKIGKRLFWAIASGGVVFLLLAIHASFLGMHWDILNDPSLGWYRTCAWGGFATCLVGVVTQLDLRFDLRWPKSLLLLGDASYSLYLLPVSLMMTFMVIIHMLNKIGMQIVIPPLFMGAFYIFGTIGGAILFWRLFEVPATRWARRVLSPSRHLPLPQLVSTHGSPASTAMHAP